MLMNFVFPGVSSPDSGVKDHKIGDAGRGTRGHISTHELDVQDIKDMHDAQRRFAKSREASKLRESAVDNILKDGGGASSPDAVASTLGSGRSLK